MDDEFLSRFRLPLRRVFYLSFLGYRVYNRSGKPEASLRDFLNWLASASNRRNPSLPFNPGSAPRPAPTDGQRLHLSDVVIPADEKHNQSVKIKDHSPLSRLIVFSQTLLGNTESQRHGRILETPALFQETIYRESQVIRIRHLLSFVRGFIPTMASFSLPCCGSLFDIEKLYPLILVMSELHGINVVL